MPLASLLWVPTMLNVLDIKLDEPATRANNDALLSLSLLLDMLCEPARGADNDIGQVFQERPHRVNILGSDINNSNKK